MKCFHSDSTSVHFRTCCYLREWCRRVWGGWGWGGEGGGEAGGNFARCRWKPSRRRRAQPGAAVVLQLWFNPWPQREQHGLEQSEPCECSEHPWAKLKLQLQFYPCCWTLVSLMKFICGSLDTTSLSLTGTSPKKAEFLKISGITAQESKLL